ncbi:MAG: hypothetical protein JW730_02580 [Anaerolineales bacterium]|nr:hypothetical protein [Anaerolineales bacterium]
MSKSKQEVIEDEEAIPVGVETAAEAALTTNIYGEIRKRLAMLGVPVDQVAFIHDAKNPNQRAKLFAAVNQGKIRVLIGSTEKMGTGMNVQERCIALHTITPPWRPGDIEQQVGRVIRQGNLFPQAAHFVHVTERSFDAFTWQLLENKAGFIAQVSSGHVTDREVDDVDPIVISFSEIKAHASGNPLIMQLIVLQADLSRLRAIRTSWEASHARVQGSIRTLEWQRQEALSRAEKIEKAIRHRDAHTTEKFSIQLKPTIDAEVLETKIDRDATGRHIRLLAEHAAQRLLSKQNTEEWIEIGVYRGFPIKVTVSGLDGDDIQLFFNAGMEILPVSFNTDSGVTRSMDIRLNSLDALLEDTRDRTRVLEKKINAAQAEGGLVWEHEGQYLQLQAKVNELEAMLNKDKDQSQKSTAHVPMPASARRSIDANRDTACEVEASLKVIRDMISDPSVLARFMGSNIWVPQGLNDEQVIEVEQTLFSSAILQFDLFGDTVSVPIKKQRRR